MKVETTIIKLNSTESQTNIFSQIRNLDIMYVSATHRRNKLEELGETRVTGVHMRKGNEVHMRKLCYTL